MAALPRVTLVDALVFQRRRAMAAEAELAAWQTLAARLAAELRSADRVIRAWHSATITGCHCGACQGSPALATYDALAPEPGEG